MRKFFAIWLLVAFTSTTEFGQLLKLPLLISHGYDHLKSGRSQNLFAFLYEHYIGDHGKDSDQNQDQQLPFKTVCADHIFYTYLLPLSEISSSPYIIKADNKKISRLIFFSNNHLKDIFHPPQIV